MTASPTITPSMAQMLQRVAAAKADLLTARDELLDEIRAARAAGLSLRQIGTAAHMSHEEVRRITLARR